MRAFNGKYYYLVTMKMSPYLKVVTLRIFVDNNILPYLHISPLIFGPEIWEKHIYCISTLLITPCLGAG